MAFYILICGWYSRETIPEDKILFYLHSDFKHASYGSRTREMHHRLYLRQVIE